MVLSISVLHCLVRHSEVRCDIERCMAEKVTIQTSRIIRSEVEVQSYLIPIEALVDT